MKNRTIVALDVDDLRAAKKLVDELYPFIKIFKIGKELFTSAGPEAIDMVHKKGAKVFLDLKFHDIPNTVAKTIKAACKMRIFMTNIHVSGGSEMMSAAVTAKKRKKHPMLLGVTVLTSLDKAGLSEVGVKASPKKQVASLALLAKKNKLDGVVCSAKEIETVRKACGKRFIIVTPGIRTSTNKTQDQKRIATPEYAFTQGADYIVIGRPITQTKDPLLAAKQILER